MGRVLAGSAEDYRFHPKANGQPVRGLSRREMNRVVERLDFYSRAMTLPSA